MEETGFLTWPSCLSCPSRPSSHPYSSCPPCCSPPVPILRTEGLYTRNKYILFSKQSIWYRGYHLVCYIFIALCFWDVSLTGPPISVDGHTESHAIMCAVWPPVYHWSLSTGAAQVHLVSGYSRYSAYPHIHTHWFWHPAFISHLSFNPYIMTHNSQQRTWCLPSCVDFFCRFHLNTLYSRVSKKIVRNVAEFLFRGFWAVKIWVFWGAEHIYAITRCLAHVHNVSTHVWTPIFPLYTSEWPFDLLS